MPILDQVTNLVNNTGAGQLVLFKDAFQRQIDLFDVTHPKTNISSISQGSSFFHNNNSDANKRSVKFSGW